MAQWQDFKDFFSSEEQDFIEYGFKADIVSLTGITEFSEIYPFSEEKIAHILGTPGASQYFLSQIIFNKAAAVAITGTDGEQWKAYKDQFSNDYKDAIQSLIDVLQKAPYSYTFANYKSTSSIGEVNTILNNHNEFWLFYSFFAIAIKNRIKQATDCWNVMENSFSGNERLKQRELFYLFQNLPKYDVFQKFLNTSGNELASDLKQYLLYYAIGNGYYLDFLVDDLAGKINDAIALNLSEEGIKNKVMGAFRQDKRNAIEALTGGLSSLGFISKFSDISSLPLKTMEFDSDLSTDYVLGFQLQPNFDFSEKVRGWYLDIYGTPISNSNIINNERYRFTSGAAPIYSSDILEIGKTYVVQYTIAVSNDSSNVFKVYDNTTEVDSVTNPASGSIRVFEFTATNGFLKFSHSSGSGLIDIDNVEVYEKIFPSQSSVKVTQVADDTHPQIAQFTLYYYGVSPGDKVFLYLDHIRTYVTVELDAVYNNTRDALINAINLAAEDEASGWSGVFAAADGDKVVVTGYENGYSFLLKFFSLKQHIVDLPDNHLFFYNLALDLLTVGQTAFKVNTETFEFNGRLLHSSTSAPLGNLRVVLTDTDAIPEINLGSEITNGSGHFSFSYNITYPAKSIRNFKLELYDGIKLNEWDPAHVMDSLEYVDYFFNYYPALSPASTTIADVLTLEGLTMPTELDTFLSVHQISTLPDIRNAGGLKYISGLPVAKDNPVVVALDAFASLDAVSKSLTVNKALIDSGYTSPLDLGLNPRPEVVSALEAHNVGSFNASQVHYVSKAYGALLQNLITGHLGSTATSQSIGTLNDELDPVFKPSCSCKDCGSAVSPLAYLTDLINYAIKYVRNGVAPIDIDFLEENFFQQFTELPHSCKSTEDLVCQQRIAIEILRRYIASLTLPEGNLTTLANETKDYCFDVYRDLLKEIGTSFEQIRNYKTATNSEKADLAEILSFPFSETFDPFTELFVDPVSADMNEQTLEVLFGIVDTRRDNFSTGAKLNDGANQITRWQLSGIKYLENTDEEGFIYLKITSTPDKVRLYKNQDVTNDDFLVGFAEGPGVSGRLSISPENESGLSGSIYITSFTPSTSIKISILPRVMCWRLKKTKELWELNDWPANDFIDHLVPVIDPDLIAPDDFRVPDALVNPKFEIWKARRIWVDDLYSSIAGAGGIQAMLNLLGSSTPINYTTIASVVYSHIPWASVPDLAALKVIFTKLKQGDAAAISEAKSAIADLKLTIESFLRLFDIYNRTFVNDEKGLVIKLNRAASTSVKQITWLTPSSVNIGDSFTVTYNLIHEITYIATSTEISDLLTGLKAAMEAAAWDLDVILSTNNDYLILTATTVNTAFQIKTKALRVPSAEELKDTVSILLQSIKLTFFADWIEEENAEGVTINSNDFWVSASKPIIGDWPILIIDGPKIDPEKIHSQDLAGRMFASGPRTLLQDRVNELVELMDTLKITREGDGLEALLVYVWGSTYLGSYGSIENILFDLLNTTDLVKAKAAENYIISTLYTTADKFKLLMEVREKSLDINDSPVTNDEWNTLYSILSSAYKERVTYPTWQAEETSASYFYWQIFKAALPNWRATLDQRSQWSKALDLKSRQPALDPDVVRPDFLAVIDQEHPAYLLWTARNGAISDLFNSIKTDYETKVADPLYSEAQAFDFIIKKYVVATEESARLIQLYLDANDGFNVGSEVSQLNLSFEALEFLIIVRGVLVDSPSAILQEELDSVFSILVQVQKERSFSTWIKEEKDDNVILSPDHFKISKYYRQNFFSEKQSRVLYWRVSNDVKKDWIDKLQARILTRENTYSFFSDIIDHAEDKHLISLRDSIIRATITDGTDFGKRADDLTEKLLIDVENNCCQKTTRVSQAIEALQLLFFSMRTGLLQDDYPDLSIQSDYFDDEWTWMGSYSTWRSAMFVTLYPENLLHPAFRKTGSSPFFQLVSAFQNENNLTPLQASCIVADYFDYIKDIASLKIVAHTPAETFLQAGRCGKGAGEAIYNNSSEAKMFQFIFAQANHSKKIYWSALDGNDAAVFSPKPWEELTPFSDVTVTKVVGTTVWAPSNTEQYLLFFVQTLDAGKEQLSYAKFDVTTGQWNSQRVDMDIEDAIAGQIGTSSVFLNKSKPGLPLKDIYLVMVGTVQSTDGILTKRVKYYKLDGKGNSITHFTHPFEDKVKIRTVYDLIDMNLFYEYRSETKHDAYTEYFQKLTVRVLGVTFTLGEVRSIEDTDITVTNHPHVTVKGTKITFKNGDSVSYPNRGFDIINSEPIPVVHDAYSSFGAEEFYIGGETINGLDLDSYIGFFTWPEGGSPSSSSFLYYKKVNDNGVYYRMFSSSQDLIQVEPIPVSGKSSFVANDFISLFYDLHGNVYSIYQRITNNPGIFIAPLYREQTLLSSAGARTNNVLSFHPNSPVVKLAYNFTSTETLTTKTDPDNLKNITRVAYETNSGLPSSFQQVVSEAFYFVPMMAALSLQNKGFYTEALDWYRLVYSYDKPESPTGGFSPRKIWYGLIKEETFLQDIRRSQNWLRDPLNPHAIAETRAYSYTKFTVQSIIKCMLSFADSEFTKDNAESVPRARVLYQTALDLLDLQGLRTSGSDCTSSIQAIMVPDAIINSTEWPEWQPVWLGILEDLYSIEDKDELENIISLIETEFASADTIDQKFSYIRDLVDDALETPDQFADFAALISSGRILNIDALNRVLMNSGVESGLKYFVSEVSKQYLNAVTNVTGIVPDALLSDNMHISWFTDHVSLVQETPGTPQTITVMTSGLPVNPYAAKKNAYYNYINPTAQQVRTMTVISDPIMVINNFYGNEQYYIPQVNPNFCVPPNPLLTSMIFSAEANLFKIRNCMNMAGMIRQLLPYAAPTDQYTGLPILGGDGRLLTTGTQNFQPTIYRFEVLIERAKQQVNVAQQIESTLLSMYEKSDSEHYNILKARQDLGLASAGVKLQDLRLKEADSNILLTQLQRDRVTLTADHYQNLISDGLLGAELASLLLLYVSEGFLIASSILSSVAGLIDFAEYKFSQATSNSATSLSTWASAISTQSSIFSMQASFERRQQDWQFQLDLAHQDLLISSQQITIAKENYDIVKQEKAIAQLQYDNAQQTLDFLATKFTNAELYDWMITVLEKAYSYFLYQATSTAKIAQNQLAFERQEPMPTFIQDDYWQAPSTYALSLGGNSTGPDRRGLTGSVRLLQDVSQLEQSAFDTEKRKLQLTKTISLMRIAPTDFQRFKETGTMKFNTNIDMFDRDFPGHYLRLVKQVKVSVVALVPPVDGIKATLRNAGLSYVVNGTDFRKNYIVRSPDSVSLSSPFNATGIFELNQQSQNLLNPFEDIGVESNWEFIMPKPSNFFDYSTIADVLVTFEYTALESMIYRNQVIDKINTDFQGDRPFSFKNNFADQWFDLSNPDNKGKNVTVTFNTTAYDFPANLSNLKIQMMSLMFVTENPAKASGNVGSASASSNLELYFTDSNGSVGPMRAQFDQILTSLGNSLGNGLENKSPIGEWQLTLDSKIIDKIISEEIKDIYFVLAIKGTTPEWPSY